MATFPTSPGAGAAIPAVLASPDQVQGNHAFPAYLLVGPWDDGRPDQGMPPTHVWPINMWDLVEFGGKYSLVGEVMALPIRPSYAPIVTGDKAIAILIVNLGGN